MSSTIHYRFNASKSEWSRLPFDGHAISLGELKRAIITAKKLNPQEQAAGGGSEGKMLMDFELLCINAETGEEYHADNTSIPKNTQLIIKRIPIQRTKTVRLDAEGGGSMDSYLQNANVVGILGGASTDGLPSQLKRNFGALSTSASRATDEFGEDPLDEATYVQQEEQRKLKEQQEREAAMAAQLQAMQQQRLAMMAAQQSQPGAPIPVVDAGGGYIPPAPGSLQRAAPQTAPPPHYVCHTCGQPGHWKQNCPRARGSTGVVHISQVDLTKPIPTTNPMMLSAMSAMPNAAAAVLSAYTNRGAPGTMPGQGATNIIAAAAAAAQARTAASKSPYGLTCPICTRLFDSPMVVNCCWKSFCNECIRQALVLDPHCPVCKSSLQGGVDQLRANIVMAKRVEKERQRLAQLGIGAPQQSQQQQQQRLYQSLQQPQQMNHSLPTQQQPQQQQFYPPQQNMNTQQQPQQQPQYSIRPPSQQQPGFAPPTQQQNYNRPPPQQKQKIATFDGY